YGEFFELDRLRLAMTPDEAAKVLAHSKDAVDTLIDAAAGWPAIIGLAAAAERPPSAAELPKALHDYLAEELFLAADPDAQRGLARLSLVPGAITSGLAEVAVGANFEAITA